MIARGKCVLGGLPMGGGVTIATICAGYQHGAFLPGLVMMLGGLVLSFLGITEDMVPKSPTKG